MFSVLLEPPPPVADWPELTLVAARAVADAIGPEATIKDPNDVLVDGRKVAGILAEAGERVVLGIGINVGADVLARRRLGRARSPGAARRRPGATRARLRRVARPADGHPTSTGLTLPARSVASAEIWETAPPW